MERIAWHPAFCGAMKLELKDYVNVLQFLEEYPLTAEPLKIDVLIIKKEPNVVIKKNLGRIFQLYNVIEYKSPEDYASVDDYNKVHAYSRFYASLKHADVKDMAVTIAVTKYPRELMKYLRERYKVAKIQTGLYVVNGDTSITQIVITSQLSEDENLWLRNLNRGLTITDCEQIAEEDFQHNDRIALRVYLDTVINANKKIFTKLQNMGGLDDFLVETGLAAKFEARGEARGKAEDVITVLRTKFGSVPKSVCGSIKSYSDLTALDSLLQSAVTCSSIKDFRQNLVR